MVSIIHLLWSLFLFICINTVVLHFAPSGSRLHYLTFGIPAKPSHPVRLLISHTNFLLSTVHDFVSGKFKYPTSEVYQGSHLVNRLSTSHQVYLLPNHIKHTRWDLSIMRYCYNHCPEMQCEIEIWTWL